jgi:hypothetical protein
MSNLAKFNVELELASKKIQGDFKKFYKQVCLEVLKRIVFRTPVDTGRARGNWQVEIGAAAVSSLIVEGTEGEMADFSMRNGIQKLSDIPAFSIVHITNNIEYIYYLEYDKRSDQFPEGMVEITLTEMALWLSGIK